MKGWPDGTGEAGEHESWHERDMKAGMKGWPDGTGDGRSVKQRHVPHACTCHVADFIVRGIAPRLRRSTMLYRWLHSPFDFPMTLILGRKREHTEQRLLLAEAARREEGRRFLLSTTTTEKPMTGGTSDLRDWPPIAMVATNPISPDDTRLPMVMHRADAIVPYRDYTILALRQLGVGVIYRPDGSPLTFPGKWLVVPDSQVGAFCIDLDIYLQQEFGSTSESAS